MNPNYYSWTSRLHTVLRPAPHPLTEIFGNSCSRLRHSPGEIWRHALSLSVYHDLAGPALGAHQCSWRSVVWRRFVRVEHLGLSGVVIYEIPIPPSISEWARDYDATGAQHCITLKTVFGDLDDKSDGGMKLDDLLDEIDAKVVYFPAYACTSFTVGQVMSAFLNDRPAHRPFPAHQGFSVCMEEQTLIEEDPTLSFALYSDKIIADFGLSSSPAGHSYPGWSPGTVGNLDYSLSIDPDDPHSALCVRSSTLYEIGTLARPLDSLFEDEEDHASTLIGCETQAPPLSAELPIPIIETAHTLDIYKDFASFLDFTPANLED